MDTDNWCYVPTGDALLTRRANRCPGRNVIGGSLLVGLLPGAGHKVGRLVKHADFGAQLANGGPVDCAKAADRLVTSNLRAPDVVGVALTAPFPVAVYLWLSLRVPFDSVWQEGAERAVATGSERDFVTRRQALASRLRHASVEEAEHWIDVIAVARERTGLYVAAGLSPTEALTTERTGTFDEDALATLAALRAVGAA